MKQSDEPLFSILKGTNLQSLQGQQQQVQTHTTIVIGGVQCGKTSMLTNILGVQPQSQSSTGLLYSYLRTNVGGQRAIIQFYEVSGQSFKHLLTLPVNQLNYNQVGYTIVVDLSDNPPEILSNVSTQINELRSTQEKLLQTILTPSEYQDLEQKSYQRIESNPDRVKLRPMLLPLVIVGWKYDQFAKNVDVDVRKWLSRGLRYLAHMNNATLVFGSQMDPSLVKQAIQNQLSLVKINQVDHMKMLYVTRGVDSVEQIGLPTMTSQQIQPIDAITKIIKEQVVVNPNPQKKVLKKAGEDWDLYKEERIDRVKKEKGKQTLVDNDNY